MIILTDLFLALIYHTLGLVHLMLLRYSLVVSSSDSIHLPVDLAWPEIEAALTQHRNLVLVAEPGAGKTTRLPPYLFRSSLIPTDKKILMLEPRRLAARAAAHRIGVEQNWPVGGNEIGYQVRFDNRSNEYTRVLVLTEGLLGRRLQTDPELKNVGCVILDEFHERSQHTDLALSLLFELQELARPDLRIIVMSATLDAERISRYLRNAPVVKVPGRTYPVAIHHSSKPLALDTGPRFLTEMETLLDDLMVGKLQREGDILVFLPGAREIRQLCERLTSNANRLGFSCLELHGRLSLDEQDRAIRRASIDNPKIICSTNIAETSLTIDGVGTVVDSGLARIVKLDAAGFDRLQLSRISLASATQRAGRAGRQGPGLCYRMWSKIDESSMPPFEMPEILRTDLTEAMLTLLSQGITDPDSFSWFEKPLPESLEFSLLKLTDLGFRDPIGGALTKEGKEALKLPLAPRFARLMIESRRAGLVQLGAKICALLSEKDVAPRGFDFKRNATEQSDLLARLHFLESHLDSRMTNRNRDIDSTFLRSVKRVIASIESETQRLKHPVENEFSKLLINSNSDEQVLKLLLLAFPDRVCRRRRPLQPAARMVGGRGVSLAPFSTVERSEFFIAIESSEPAAHLSHEARGDVQISIASRIEREWLTDFFPSGLKKVNQIVYHNESNSVQKHWSESFHDLPLEEPHVSRPTPDEAFAILIEAAKSSWASRFLNHEELKGVFSRLQFLKSQLPGEQDLIFDFSLIQNNFLNEICFGEVSLEAVLSKNLTECFLRNLPSETHQLLNKAAPDYWVAPTGNRIRVQYPDGRPPFIEIRIQEIFGLKQSPLFANDKCAVVMHLLGPNYRPVQVTSDLGSFWKNGYLEVRKELRSRYPKHSWPDNPLSAQPEAKGRRRT